MGSVTHVDFQAARHDPVAAQAAADAWADHVATWWYTPTVRLILCACSLGVILVGLAVLVFGVWLLMRAL